jgi:cystathionine gamma-synthase
MTQSNRPLAPATRAAQALGIIDEVTGAVIPPIIPSSTFARDSNYLPRQDYIYGRDGGPTVKHAEAVLASLDGAERSLLFASGQAAATALFETLKSGDHVVAPRIMYHGIINWLLRLKERRGIGLSFYDPALDGALEAAIRPGQTRLVWVETPANPTWTVVDIAAAARVARTAGALLAVDSTAAPAVTTRPLEFGADVTFQSATKYLGGHSDLTAGVLSFGPGFPLAEEIETIRTLGGSVIAAFEAWLLIRGLRTLFLRYERASANALKIALHFQGHDRIAKLLYPGLPAHPRHEVARAQMTGGFGGMMSIMAGSEAAARKIALSCRLFIPATSLGGVESLIEHRKAVEGPNSAVAPDLLRLSVGIEDAEDLIADLAQALDRA